MRLSLRLTAAILATVPLCAAQQPPRDRAAAPAAVEGKAAIAGRVIVRDEKPAVPVRRARVTLSSARLPESRITDTDKDGRYRFDGLPAGAYRIRVEKPGYVTLEYGARRAYEQPPPVDVKDGETRAADLALPRGAGIEGRITNDAGEPVQNIVVSAVRFVVTAAGRRPLAIGEARTDDLGRYRVHSLPAGEYYVGGAPDPRDGLDTVPGLPNPPGFARTYFPGTVQPHEARKVALAAGQDARGVDIALSSVPLSPVAGRVLDSTGKPAPTRSVRLQAVGGPPGDVRGLLPKPGVFRFPAVPAGEYWMLAAYAAPGADPEFAATRLTVSGQPITDLLVTLSKGAVLAGRVEYDGSGTPPSNLRLISIEPEFEMPPLVAGERFAVTLPAGGGDVAIAGLFGPRVLRVNGLPARWALKGIWLADAEITDAVIDFRGSNAPRPLRIVLTDKTATVEATVTDARGRPASGRLIVFSADERRWGPISRFVKVADVSAAGTTTIEGLLPGDYLVTAVEYLEDESWNDVDVLRRLRAGATPLTVAERQTARVTLTLKEQP